jgi:hypothetical protein
MPAAPAAGVDPPGCVAAAVAAARADLDLDSRRWLIGHGSVLV